MKFDKLLLSAAVAAALAGSTAFAQQDQAAQKTENQQDQAAASQQSASPSPGPDSASTDSSSGNTASSGSASSSGSGDDVVAVPVPVPSPVFIPVPVEEGAEGRPGRTGQAGAASPGDLGGESVYSSEDELLGVGEIQEVVRSKQDGRLYAVVSSEEPLQVDDLAAVPLSAFRMQEDNILFSGNEQQFEQLFERQPYEEEMYEPLDEARNEQAGIQ